MDLKRAGLHMSLNVYASAVVLAMIFGALIGGSVTFTLSYILFFGNFIVVAILSASGIAIGILGGLIVMFIYPRLKILERKIKLGEELPYIVSHMATLAASGMSPERMFKILAEEESGEVTIEEARMIVRDIEILGKDVITAIDNAIVRSPNPVFAGFLQGLKAAIISGTNIAEYLSEYAKSLMTEKRITIKMLTETLGVFSEMYTVLLIVFPIVLVIMLSLITVLSPQISGFNITDLLLFITYFVIPVFGLMFLILVDAMMPKK
jgi:flagellar protein FlaJ